MDAFSQIQAWCRNRFVAALLLLLALEPAISATVTRLLRHRHWFSDWDAVVCAAQAVRTGQNPYSLDLNCPGLDPAGYVYAPQIAKGFAPVIGWLGLDGARWLGLVLILPAMAFLIWYVLVRRFDHLPASARLMGFAAVRGSTLSTANIGFPMQALAVWARLAFREKRWPFVAAVILGGLIKPIFLANLLVLLVEDRPIFDRLRAFTVSAMAGTAAIAAMVLTAGPLFTDWTIALHEIVLTEQPGVGFAKLAAFAGLGSNSVVSLGLFVVISGALTASVMAIAQWGRLTADERVLLGLGLAQLINPRINDYDLYMLFPALALAVMALRTVDTAMFRRLSWLYVALTVGNVLAVTLAVKALRGVPATYVAACALVITSGMVCVLPRAAEIRRNVDQTVAAAMPGRRRAS